MRIAIIGAGYVGLNTGAALAYLGHEVLVIDRNQARIRALENGEVPIHEPGLPALLSQARDHLTFDGTLSGVRKADVVFIAVGTPEGANGEAHIGFVEDAACQVAQQLDSGQEIILVVKSTVPIGTGNRVRHVVERELAKTGIDARVHMAANPEFLREGQALKDSLYPDRIVVGAHDENTFTTLRQLYSPILQQSFQPPPELPRAPDYPLPAMVATDPTSAEMIKYAANAFLAVKLSYVNEIAALCERVGADIKEVARGMGLDQRIGAQYLAPGPGWGGSCLPKDTAALLSVAGEYGDRLLLVEAAREINRRQRQRVVEKLQECLKILRGCTIGILGLAFKEGTDDLRDSPALEIVALLLARGVHLRLHDPQALSSARREFGGQDVDFYDDPYTLAVGADALVVLTPWDEYRQLDLKRLVEVMRKPVMVDARNLYQAAEVRKLGMRYSGIGQRDE